MLDKDLADLYKVTTGALNQAVKRNPERFPDEFMFQLTKDELNNLKSQFVTSSWGGVRKLPFVFTEHGVLMLSSVLKSDRAIQVNIQIMRIFTRLRRLVSTNKKILEKIEAMETKYDAQFKVVFDAIRQLLTPPEEPKKPIGFRMRDEEGS
jgi:hypothetical protein